MIQLHRAWNSKELHRPPQSSLHTRVYCCCAHNSKEREPVSSFISRQVGERQPGTYTPWNIRQWKRKVKSQNLQGNGWADKVTQTQTKATLSSGCDDVARLKRGLKSTSLGRKLRK